MKCLICNRIITKKLSWTNLFKSDDNLRCERCNERYKINFNNKIFELDNGYVDLYRLFDKKLRINHLPYIYELGEILDYIIKRYDYYNDDYLAIIYFDDSFSLLNNYKLLNQLFLVVDKIIIISLY